MSDNIYERLAAFLDDLPGGFPRSESGVELRILSRLFSPEEAALVLHLSLIAEEAPVIAVRAGIPLLEARRILNELERKRLVYAFHEPGKPPRYMAEQFVIGFWEGQVDRLDRELVELFEEYLPVYARSGVFEKIPQLRTIPVRESIPVPNAVLSYEDIDQVLASHRLFAVMNCICRQEQAIAGHPCHKPPETCLAFDGSAEYVVRDGRGRWITREEARAIVAQAEASGLVLQPGNERTSANLCMCCGCCCGVLRSLKLNPRPARIVASSFYAVLDQELCAGCGACLERCQMDALSLTGPTAELDSERCIGCGLCVTTCPSGALALARKPAIQQPGIPRTPVHLAIQLAQSRGRLGPLTIAHIAAHSAIDRLRAAILKLPDSH